MIFKKKCKCVNYITIRKKKGVVMKCVKCGKKIRVREKVELSV